MTADYVNITGFSVKNATGGYGIVLRSDHCTISGNTVTNNPCGIVMEFSSNNTLTDNTANSNFNYGILLSYSNDNILINNTANSNKYDHGICLGSSNHNTLINNTANSNNKGGIYLGHSDNNTVTNSTCNLNKLITDPPYYSGGIDLYYSDNNTFANNIANSNYYTGFRLYSSNYNTVMNNTANLNDIFGIYLNSSSNNLIYNNYFNNTNNTYDDGNNIWNITKTEGTNIIGGSWLGGNYWSDYAGDDLDGDGLGDTLSPYNSSGNITNGGDWLPLTSVGGILPVHNLNTSENFETIHAAIDAINTTDGHTITVDPGTYNENVDVTKSLTIRTTSGNSEDTIVQAANSSDHVFEVTADYVNISGFTMKGATWNAAGINAAGIYLNSVNHCDISNNNALDNGYGSINLYFSSNNNLTDNIASNSGDGIKLYYSNNNILSNNIASNNNREGICLWYSSNNTLTDNTMSENDYNFGVYGDSLSDFIQNIDTSNLVDGRTVYYWVDQQNRQIPGDAGYVGIVNSTNITVRDLTLANNCEGILLAYSEKSRIENVTGSSNWWGGIRLIYSNSNILINNNASRNNKYQWQWHGIYLSGSSDNIITNNTASNNGDNGICLVYSNNNILINNNASKNDEYGIYLGGSSNNIIYLNNFIDNTYSNVHSSDSTNIWNSTLKMTYTYNGSQYTNYLGNYWDDYTDVDVDNDGIWDSPLPIDSDMDYHPLVELFENYVPVPPVSSLHDLNATACTTWINWTWKNPDDEAFNHTMIYINNACITNTSGTNYNLTNLLPGTTHTISTRTVSTEGVLSDTWLNDTVTTAGALPGGLFIDAFEPEMYSVYTVGDTMEFNITVMNPNGTSINDVSAYAVLSGPNDTLKHIILSNKGTNFLGNYTFSKEDPRGIWMADIIAYKDTSSGHASVKIFFIRPYYIQPRTDKLTYISGETANLYAQVMNSKNLTQFLTDEDLTLNMSVYQFNETTPVIEPFEMPFNITSNEFQASIDTSLLESGVFTVLFEGMDNAGNIEVTSLRIGISKDFSVVVNTDKTYYDRGDSVNISGTVTFADSSPFTNANVTVCIDLRGFRRSYPTTTDENGEFNFTFQPFASEAGDYKVKAEVWNVGLLKADETQFTIQGLYLAPPQATFNMVENSTQTINFILYNLGDNALTGINANVEDLDISDNVNAVIIDVPDEVSPHEQIELILQINAGVPVPDKAEFIINVTTDQMSNEASELTINLFSPEPVMVVNPGHISVGLNQHQTKIETVTVSNIGYGFLRNLTLNQPNESWMRITSNTSIGDLAPGENISFDIHIHSYNVSFGAYHDTVNITSDNYNAAQVNLTVNITELANGSLLFHVNDYFGRNVTANISVIDDITYHEYTTTTNSTGYAFVSELPTGRYIYEVSSYNETLSSQLGSVIVEPSITKRVNVTLPISFIDFEWNVTPTTIEDWYKVVLNMTFETDVPIPIIVAFPPYLEYDLQTLTPHHVGDMSHQIPRDILSFAVQTLNRTATIVFSYSPYREYVCVFKKQS